MAFSNPDLEPGHHLEVVRQMHRNYETAIADGSKVPLTLNLLLYSVIITIVWLMIPPLDKALDWALRLLTVAAILYIQIFILLYTKSMNISTAFAAGMGTSWFMLYLPALILLFDVKRDFKAVSWRTTTSNSARSSVQREYFWKTYPASLWERFLWNTDLLLNFRGVSWSWKISGLPTYPAHVQRQLDPQEESKGQIKDIAISRNGIKRYDNVRGLLLHHAWLATKSLLAADAILTLARYDPFFSGLIETPAPRYVPQLIRQSPALTIFYRGATVLVLLWLGLRFCYSLAPLVFVGLTTLITSRWRSLEPHLNTVTDPWLYPDYFGSYSNVFDRGLAGWWGGWWHQIFRFPFDAWGKALSKSLGLNPRQTSGRLCCVVVAFVLSGVLHAGGSTSFLGSGTQPLQGPFLFFCLQPIGIFVEMGFKSFAKTSGLSSKFPKWSKQALNFVWVHYWFYLTAPIFIKDLAVGGLLLTEPPVSLWRAIFGGVPGETWWTLGPYPILKWHSDPQGRWWLSGIAI